MLNTKYYYRVDEKDKEITKVTWSIESAEKGGYDHYMKKEMFEQPSVVRDTLNGRLSNSSNTITFDNANINLDADDKAQDFADRFKVQIWGRAASTVTSGWSRRDQRM